ncbi:MAG: carboxypeptidase regulatory-like domain-containing protein [Candidatus Eisenbacteria bacterium]|uniref:Carboxypeptidase regulatory-like domain-containing protein n=1 Tax=Eiseniibacteriota bacterium TaxID=2212470 RepID=A0A538TM62_UNCEI|nr:MAG: carboxypeptidase regulatory-like domain-containing protein [Candidatus Eisenbacteria bacterium]
MSRVALLLVALLLLGIISCSDMPTAPIVSAPAGSIVVEGTLRDRDGPALANAFVAFRSTPISSSQSFYTNTDATGAFRITLVQGTYEVRIGPPYESGLPSVTIPKFDVRAAGTRLDYRYSGTRVIGDVTGPGGALLDDSYVSATSDANQIYVSTRAVRGHYSMLLPQGAYEFYGDPGSYSTGIPNIEVAANISTSDTVVNFALTGHAVTVTTTLGGSTPIPNVQLQAESGAIGVRATATTRLDGSAVLYLPGGGYSFVAYSSDGSIVGPETGYWSISGDASIAIVFPATRWDVTLRRASDSSPIPFTYINALEIGSNRSALTRSDLFGTFRLFVRPSEGYDLRIGSVYSPEATIPNVSSTADSTFDLYVDLPVNQAPAPKPALRAARGIRWRPPAVR